MAQYQILYWQDLPAQIKVFDPGKRTLSLPLPESFQNEIDRVATEEGLALAPQLSERNSALQLFQIEPCEEARGVVAVNGVKLPALFGNGFTSVDLEPG